MKKANQNTQALVDEARQAKALASEYAGGIMSLTDALQTIDYLNKRRALCVKCGHRLAELENQYNLHCTVCKNDNQSYNPAKGVTGLDKILCERLGQWVATVVEGNG